MKQKPLMVDLYAGLGGWASGGLAEGFDVYGFDIEQHVYGHHRYPAQLVVQDVLTLHGSQFKGATIIVASPPCQFFSYCAMPWSKAKTLAKQVRADPVRLEKELALFNACFRIQREACEAAGRHIPMVVENVRGAQKWVGRARWSFGSFYLWGDVPALMPIVAKHVKVPGMGQGWYPPGDPRHVKGLGFNTHAARNCQDGVKNPNGGSWNLDRPSWTPDHSWTSGTKNNGGDWFNASQPPISRMTSSKSPARKMASAMIAKIPLTLSRHIDRTFYPH